LPAYQDYTVRARVTEVILAGSSCRTAVTDVVSNATQADISALLPGTCSIVATKMVLSGAVDANGVITIQGDPAGLAGSTDATHRAIEMKPYIAGVALVGTTDGQKTITEWKCGPAALLPMPTKYLPGSCKIS
jgi:type IV pilus assembly protein PilA